MAYQLFYMAFTICGFDEAFHQLSLYCWYKGCWPQQWLERTENSWLYILRDVNDAAIVYAESTKTSGDKEQDLKKWSQVSEGTGKTIS